MSAAGVAARQREEVSDYLAAHPDATAEQIGAALVLPTWSVQVRRAELRGEPIPYRIRRATE